MLQPSEEIKSKLDIVDVIRDYIPIKAAGVNFKAPCPFHREKTPSFMVSPEKQIWHCFGCGKGGDIFSFVMEIEGIGFAESLRMLAPKAGVTLRRQNPEMTSQRNRLLDILEAATNYYHDVLLESSQAEAARNYLKERGLTPETISAWQVGYAPESWDDVINYLKGRGFSDNEIFLAGMSIKKEGNNRFYNRFRDRIMFPVFDINGAPVAFSGRINPAKEATEQQGKYINSPSTPIYDKSNLLFGLDRAKMEIKAQDLAVVVEGQMDVITAHQHGFKNVIASSGTALTAQQVKLIKRYSNNIALAFDMDQAGQMAAERGMREAMQEEMNIKIIVLEEGKDPDECIKNDPGDWAEAVKEARPMMDYYFDKTFEEFNIDEAEGKREAAKRILNVIINLGSSIERDHWIKKLAQRIDVGEDALRETIQKAANKNTSPQKTSDHADEGEAQVKRSEPLTREDRVSENLLSLALKFPALIEYIADHITIDYIFGLTNKFIYKNLIIYYNNIKDQGRVATFGYQDFKLWLKENCTKGNYWQELNKRGLDPLLLLDRFALLADRDFYSFSDEEAKNEIIQAVSFLKKNYFFQRMKEVEKLIAQAEEKGENNEVNNLMQELKDLSDEMRKII